MIYFTSNFTSILHSNLIGRVRPVVSAASVDEGDVGPRPRKRRHLQQEYSCLSTQ